MKNNVFKSIGIIGLGLIGGSFAKAFHKLGISVYGLDNSKDTLIAASETNIFEGLTDNLNDFLEFDLELIYISLPITSSIYYIKELGDKNIKIPITDTGSTKYSIVDEAKKLGLNFCGGHPVKGKETSGFNASEDNFFINTKHILTPVHRDNLVDNLVKLHKSVGMDVVIMKPKEHDTIFAQISHLPHLIAFCLVDSVAKYHEDSFSYIGGGFKDFTRIAGSCCNMWGDIFLDNSHNLLESIKFFEDRLSIWKELVINNDKPELRRLISKVSTLRKGL